MYNHSNVPKLILEGLVETLNQNAKIPHTLIVVINDKSFWNNKDLLEHHVTDNGKVFKGITQDH